MTCELVHHTRNVSPERRTRDPRRVATLVAQEAPAADLFAKVAEEVAGVFGERIDSAILRLERDDTATVVAVWGQQPPGGIRVDARLPLDGCGVTARVFRERRPVRVDDYATADGTIADHARTHGIRSAVGCAIQVQGRSGGAEVCGPASTPSFRASTFWSRWTSPARACRRKIEASAYFIVAEALTSVVKHSRAARHR